MIKPDCNKIMELSKEYLSLPVYKEIYSDIITPISLLRKLSNISGRYFLLESVEGGQRWGRYSFLGFNPIMRIKCKNKTVTIEGIENKEIKTNKPLEVLREYLKKYKSPKFQDMPLFTGGFVGYFGYNMIGYAEPVLKLSTGQFNDMDMLLFDKVIAFDHLKQKIYVIVNMKTDNILENYGKAISEIEKIVHIITENGMQRVQKPVKNKPSEFICNVTKEQYCNMVEKTKQYILDGDIFQAVISRRFETQYTDSLINAYRVLRTTNPSPYMVFMHIDGDEIMSTSPETLVRLQDGILYTFPVAGSRPRGRDELEDIKLEKELLQDEKELAEHNMLVDLARNDLGRISQYSSVKVTDYMMIHKYSKIMHITSQVQSKICKDKDACDAIEAVLPAGTLSGAPKIRACEIIEEIEKTPRGIYGGALGYLDFTGNMDTCIAIRMAVKKDGKVYVQAGGGIVADSIPESEYEESGNKAKAVMDAIIKAGEVDEI